MRKVFLITAVTLVLSGLSVAAVRIAQAYKARRME